MNLFWVLCELPAPDLFLSATLVHEGEMIAVLCTAPSDVVVTRFFFCKDGAPVSFKKATYQNAQYIINASLSNAGQYFCGYQQKDAKNQMKTSALSIVQNLIVQPVSNQKIIYGVVGVTILVLVLLIYLLVKKGALLANHWCLSDVKDSEVCTSTVLCRQRSSRQDRANTEHIPFDYVEETAVKDNSRNLPSEEVQYAALMGLHQTAPSPSRNIETTAYATITPLYRQPA
nr:uncharacterized protein LOC118095088 isoform X2 [Zootoca vivipara]